MRDISSLSIIIKLSLACLCGGVIGFDRIKKRRPAGLKTHILVCIGSALAMITNEYIYAVYGGNVDPARLGAQVISGIGFLGAGTIIVTGKQQIKGLTTAAGLWASAAMGLAIGVGFYSAAIIGCAFIFVVMTAVQKIDDMVLAKTSIFEVYIEFLDIKYVKDLINYTKENDIKILGIQLSEPSSYNPHGAGALVTVQITHHEKHKNLVASFAELEGILTVEEIY